jgi:ubiquinone/menaquinone biosynthesis C-methylase UbiE
LTGAAWLDVHFAACRPEYEAMLRSVELQPGWRVLDAGSGGGRPPLIAEAVGPAGAIAALDLAPDNVATVERRAADWGLATPVAARVGSVTTLPYPDDHFDAVWFAATSQYLTDEELAKALTEFRRVVRPAGWWRSRTSTAPCRASCPRPRISSPTCSRRWRAAARSSTWGSCGRPPWGVAAASGAERRADTDDVG